MPASKNTKGRKVQKPKTKKWVVPIEATITGFITVEALDEEVAVEVVDQQIEDLKFDIIGGKTIDGADFIKFVQKSEVSSALALEDVFVAKATRKPKAKSQEKPQAKSQEKPQAKPQAKKATKKTTTAKATKKGRTRGSAKATDPSTGKDVSKTETKTKAKSSAQKGRTRGGTKE